MSETISGASATPVLVDAGTPLDDDAASLRLVHIDDFEPAVPLTGDGLDACRRRFRTLFVDEARTRRGGLGRVSYVTNAKGEAFALKTLLLPDGDGSKGIVENREADRSNHQGASRRGEMLRSLFREEYESHRALSNVKGFPRLYGRGTVDGAPAIIMEWVEGMTLSQARRRLALDDQGRLSPLTAARLGCDLFDLLSRMSLVGSGFVHRDISPANIMVRTGRLSVEEQAAEGRFDLCLIDFGSATVEPERDEATSGGAESFTSVYASPRRATPAYAAPEMLSDDLPDAHDLRRSPAVDVYEAASVLYELVTGRPPFELEEGTSAFRRKVDEHPAVPVTLHTAVEDVSPLLGMEPEVALAIGDEARELGVSPDSPELHEAFAQADGQLAGVILACLAVEQRDRPAASEVLGCLRSFCAHYTENVLRALGGEPLIPCTADESWLTDSGLRGVRRAVRRVGAGIALGAWLAVAISASMALAGASVRMQIGGVSWEGALAMPAIFAMLSAPGVLAILARWQGRGSRAAFLRATVVLLAALAGMLIVALQMQFDQEGRLRGLFAGIVACAACAWFMLVLGFVLGGDRVRRRARTGGVLARMIGRPPRAVGRGAEIAAPASPSTPAVASALPRQASQADDSHGDTPPSDDEPSDDACTRDGEDHAHIQ